MNLRPLLFLALVGMSAVIAAGPTVPNKRPLTAAAIQAIGTMNVVVDENNNGIEKSWVMIPGTKRTDYAATPAAVAIIDAIRNLGPLNRARKAAGELREVMSAEALTASLGLHLRNAIPAAGSAAAGISIGSISTVQKIRAGRSELPVSDALELATSYTMADDASAIRIVVEAHYDSGSIDYVSPYAYNGKLPSAEKTGPIYRNVFTYRSVRLPLPTLTPEHLARLVAAIEESYRSDAGVLPPADSKEGRALQKELELAHDDVFTKDEVSVVLMREWLANGGAMLKREIETAHAFVAKYLIQDLNSTVVPPLSGRYEELETEPGQWIVRRVDGGVAAGSYEHVPDTPGDFTMLATYGDDIAISKVQRDKIGHLRTYGPAKKSKPGDRRR